MVDKDDFRVKVEVEQPKQLLHALSEAKVSASERAALGRVATSVEGDHIFLYADSKATAEIVRESVRGVMDRNGILGSLTVWRWHPIEERWEDAEKPLPDTEAKQEQEHERLIEEEDEESRESPYAEWEVRVTLPTHHDARALAERLHTEGVPLRDFWRHLLIGAPDEDAAQALASRVRSESPEGSEVIVEAVGQPIWEDLNPYSIFGGLGV